MLLLALLPQPAAWAQSSNAAELYAEALEREAALREDLDSTREADPSSSVLQRIRVLVGAYEDLAQLFPDSGYGDKSLWQGGQLAADAFERFGQAFDRATALRLLGAVSTRFPTSALAKEVPRRIARLKEGASPPPTAPAPVVPAPVTLPPPVAAAPAAKPAVTPADAPPPRAAAAARTSPPAPARPAPAAPTSAPPPRPAAVAPAPAPEVAPAPPPRAAVAPPAPAPPAASPGTPGTLLGIRREVLPEALRFTLELDREVTFRDEPIGGPPRVYVDLYNTRAGGAVRNASIPYADGDVVDQVRVGRQLDSRTRVVFDLNGAKSYSVYPLYNPYRIVFDFKRPDAGTSAPAIDTSRRAAAGDAVGAAGARVPAPRPPAVNADGRFSLSRQLGLRVTRIVVDPGHGGHDPGAQGNGVTESDLVLDVALRLEKRLAAEENVEVILTRRTNAYLSLEDRTALANEHQADLFLSIHANAIAAASVRGLETYFLNFAPNPEAEAIAARENAGSSRSMRELSGLVEAIAANNKRDESRDFAAAMQATLYDRLRRVNRNLRNLGVKQAPFVVLVGAGMPSILTEISFMSNRQEAALLKTEKYRQQIADALFDGIVKYRDSLNRAPAVATR